MSMVLIMPGRDMVSLRNRLLEIDPEVEVEIWPDTAQPERVRFAVSWNHPPGALGAFPNLEAVSSFGAGVDHFLRDPLFPSHLQVTRIVCSSLADDMADYLLCVILSHFRRINCYGKQAEKKMWKPRPYKRRPHLGLLGLGELGRVACERFTHLGFPVSAWSRTGRTQKGVTPYQGKAGLNAMVKQIDALICMLPLTTQTRGILCKDFFHKLKPGCWLVNVGRGEHLVEEDLIPAMDAGWLSGACLDVLQQEPPPRDHPFWDDPRIILTPHGAAETDPNQTARQLVENYQRLLKGEPLKHQVSLDLGY